MNQFTKEELEDALRAIDSTISKCEKVQPKLKAGTAQHTLLVRRIKAFQIASMLINEEMTSNKDSIHEFERLIKTTKLQQGYQEFVSFFRQLRTYLQKELPKFVFTGNIVENNMDYAYFQFTNEVLKAQGLKIVIAFVYADFTHQIWLSGINREIQRKHYEILKATGHPYTLTDNPNKTDYILRTDLIAECNFGNLQESFQTIRANTLAFIKKIET